MATTPGHTCCDPMNAHVGYWPRCAACDAGLGHADCWCSEPPKAPHPESEQFAKRFDELACEALEVFEKLEELRLKVRTLRIDMERLNDQRERKAIDATLGLLNEAKEQVEQAGGTLEMLSELIEQ